MGQERVLGRFVLVFLGERIHRPGTEVRVTGKGESAEGGVSGLGLSMFGSECEHSVHSWRCLFTLMDGGDWSLPAALFLEGSP